MIRTKLVPFICFSALFVSACDGEVSSIFGDSLTRERARELIVETPIPSELYLSLGTNAPSCLREMGVIGFNMGGGWLTSKGRNYFKDMKLSTLSGENGFIFAQPVRLAVNDITGIAEPADDTSAQPLIEFVATYVFEGVDEADPVRHCLPKYNEEHSFKANAIKYDDGWRINYLDLPTAPPYIN